MTTLIEVPVRLTRPLRGAALVDPSLPLPPLPEPPPPPPPPEPEPEPPPPAEPEPVAEEPIPPKIDENERRLAEERGMIEQALHGMTRSVRAFIDQRSHDRTEWRESAVELALTAAVRLVHDLIESGEFPVETVVRELIGRAGQGPITVFLNPKDSLLLQSRLDGRPLVEGDVGIKVATDPELGRGDCRVEGSDGFVSSELVVQLAEMRGRLLRSLDHAQG